MALPYPPLDHEPRQLAYKWQSYIIGGGGERKLIFPGRAK
jgi:hypothetical protein